MISESSIEQLLNIVAIEDVVGDYVNIKRSGSRFKGSCPFHDEKTASFILTPSMGIYKCFGCQKAGNSVGFLMEIEQYSYVEALKALASKYNFELEETFDGTKEEYEAGRLKKQNQQVAMNYALQHFMTNLWDKEEGKAIGQSYFKQRGYSTAIIKKWQLGFASDSWTNLYAAVKKDKYDLETFADVGLLRKKENEEFYDWYRNRVIFPIHSVSGNVIAFAGRILGTKSDKEPKYVNSPETELYHKSNVLFGMYQAKTAIKKAEKVYLVEGYTDVISLAQAGVENVVASSGTALTEGQIRLIKRFTNNITVLYDGDAAGQKASERGIDIILEAGLNVRVVAFPEGEDPDSYCQKLGPEKFAEFLNENEQNFIYFKARSLFEEAVLKDPILKAERIKDILVSVSKIPDGIKRNALMFELSRICEIDEAILTTELNKLTKKSNFDKQKTISEELRLITNQAGVVMPKEPLTDEWQEKALFKLLLEHADKSFVGDTTVFQTVLSEFSNDPELMFTNEVIGLIFHELNEMDVPDWPGQKYYVNHSDSNISQLAIQLLNKNYTLSEHFADNHIYVLDENSNFRHELVSVVLHLRRKKLDNLIRNKISELEKSDVDVEYILEHISYLNEAKLRIANELGGTVYQI